MVAAPSPAKVQRGLILPTMPAMPCTAKSEAASTCTRQVAQRRPARARRLSRLRGPATASTNGRRAPGSPATSFPWSWRVIVKEMASNPDAADMAGLMHARGRDKDRASLAETAIVPRAEVESRLKRQRELLTQIQNSVKREILRRLEVAGACRSSEDHRRWENVSPSPDGLETLEGDSDTGGLTLEEANEQLTNAGVDVGALFRERLPDGGHKLVQSIKSLEARLCPPKADAATPGSAPARAAEPVVQDVGAIYEVPPT